MLTGANFYNLHLFLLQASFIVLLCSNKTITFVRGIVDLVICLFVYLTNYRKADKQITKSTNKQINK